MNAVNEQRSADSRMSNGTLADSDLNCSIASEDEVDAALLRRIVKQDQQALEKLYHRYYQRLTRFIYRVAGHSDVLEEIINDTFYVVWSKAETFHGGARVSTWIFGIAYNKVLKSLKSQYRQQPVFDSELMDTLQQVVSDDSYSDTDKWVSENWFNSAFALLPAEQRATVELTYYHDMSYQEIAALMQCSENTVKTRMFHARKKLQVILPRLADAEPLS